MEVMTTTPAVPERGTAPAGQPAGRWRLAGMSVELFGLALLGWLVFAFLIVGVSTLIVWIGVALLVAALGVLRPYARLHRQLAGIALGTLVPDPYRTDRPVGLLSALRFRLTDPATWRDMLWLLVRLSLGFCLQLGALIGYVLLPIGYWVSPWLLRIDAAITQVFLEPRETRLEERITSLESTRARSVDSSAAELRRIERDLHDGAQARLVSAGMDLGLAEMMLATDPGKAKEHLARARESHTGALSDLRSLVRGIHPPVLADRGLVGGIQSLALASPMTVELDGALPGRPPAPVEAALYFAVAETLTNAAKHAAARNVSVWLRHETGVLTVQVVDDGVGGATVTPGGGLAGIVQRLEVFDGTVAVTSPLGGPTVLTMAVPCNLVPVPAAH